MEEQEPEQEPFERNTLERTSRGLLTAERRFKPFLNCNAVNYENLYTGGRLIADKTLFIRELYSMGALVRITLPRRMGKTILLTMAKSFFELPKGVRYGNKSEMPKEKSPNYKLFKDTLIFERESEFANEYFGQIPTVYLSLHNISSVDNWDQFQKSFAFAIQKAYKDFSYLREKASVDRSHKNLLKEVLNSPNKLTIEQLKNAVNNLTEMLHDYHGTKVLLLIDEYDGPVKLVAKQKALSDSNLDDVASKILEFQDQFLVATLKSNQYLERGLLAGIMRVTSGKLSSSLTYEECNLANTSCLSRYFGFSEALVDDLRKKLEEISEKKLEPAHLDMAKSWYNGYFFDRDEKFYNPYSMSAFLKNYPKLGMEALQCYWTSESATINNVENALKRKEIAEKIQILLRKGNTDHNDDEEEEEEGANFFSKADLIVQFTSINYQELEKLCFENNIVNNDSIKLVMSFLCHMGYLSLTKNGYPIIPNNEGRIYLQSTLMKYYERKYSFDSGLTDAVTDQIVSLISKLEENPSAKIDTKRLKKAFQNFLQAEGILGQLFAGEIPCESFAHAMLSYMSVRIYNKNNKCLIHDRGFPVEKRHSTGEITKNWMRPDIAFDYSKTKTIVELKYHTHGTAVEALEEAKFYQLKLFNSLRSDILHRIFIGMHVAKNGEVTIVNEYQDGKTLAPDMETPKKFKPDK